MGWKTEICAVCADAKPKGRRSAAQILAFDTRANLFCNCTVLRILCYSWTVAAHLNTGKSTLSLPTQMAVSYLIVKATQQNQMSDLELCKFSNPDKDSSAEEFRTARCYAPKSKSRII